MTYTYAVMDVSPAVYEEVKRKLLDAGYQHAVIVDGGKRQTLDMHGIALQMQHRFDVPPRLPDATDPNQSYSALERAVAAAPRTWIPQLLRALVRTAVDKRVFKIGGLVHFVEGCVQR